MGLSSPHSTLPLNLHVPQARTEEETSHDAKQAFKGQVEREDLRRGQVTSVKHNLGRGQVELFKNKSRETIQS